MVIAVPEHPHLRAVPSLEGDPLEGDSLTLAYAALKRVRAERGLQRLTVAVDDPRLGRQLFVAPRAGEDHAEPGSAVAAPEGQRPPAGWWWDGSKWNPPASG